MVEPNATTMIYQLALSQVPHIGPVLARNLVAYCGSAEAVFSESFSNLKRIPGIGDKLALEICGFKNFDRLFREVEFINANNIQVDFFTDASYPFRLRQIPGAPVALFRKGGFDLDHNRVLAIIGTRKSSKSSRDAVLGLVKELKSSAPLIVSGLAYGIDSVAHRAAVENGLSTVGVLGHGLDRIYPARNTGLANSMMLNGGLLTEFMSNTKPDRENFPKRNRIVAGLVDAVLVVESPLKGGSVITANL
ncbi:MAG: DNA-processing protein DprA, partial [Bacteroidia bacterium]|nr:DNA-processing protein DprA [Bacteroidia bacterium]